MNRTTPSKTHMWLTQLRLRTLPLSVSGAITAAALAWRHGVFSLPVFLLTFLTTALLQILSNLANDLGDGLRGTDNAQRKGPLRAVGSGVISAAELLRVTLALALLCCVSGLGLLIVSFGWENLLYIVLFCPLGGVCIAAAVKYTAGKKPYGYMGLGDAGVFIFFGLVSVTGGLFLYTKMFDLLSLLPAAAIGLLSVGVLNMNNLRDTENDLRSGKMTIAGKLGIQGAKKYQMCIILSALLLLPLYNMLTGAPWQQYLFLIVYPLPLFHLVRVMRTRADELGSLDRELKTVALSCFFISILFLLGSAL